MKPIPFLVLTALAVMPACGGDEPIERPVERHAEHDEWEHLDQSREKKTEAGTFTVEYTPEPDRMAMPQVRRQPGSLPTWTLTTSNSDSTRRRRCAMLRKRPRTCTGGISPR